MAAGSSAIVGSAGARNWARKVLPRVSRTFAVNIRVLSGSLGDAVRTAYLMCRVADTLEDSWPGTADEIRRRFALLESALDGDAMAITSLAHEVSRAPDEPDLQLVADLPAVFQEFMRLGGEDRSIIADAVRTMIRGMCGYAARAAERKADTGTIPYLDTEVELHDYCWVVAGCVGVMLTRLYAVRHPGDAPEVRARRLELSPVVGEALQLTNILLDWPRDVRRGRCHVPAAWLAEHGLTPEALVEPTGMEARALAERLESMARLALERVPDYLSVYPATAVRYRMFVLLPALWALASLRNARRDPAFPIGPSRPRLPRSEVRQAAVAAFVAGHTRAGVERLFASMA